MQQGEVKLLLVYIEVDISAGSSNSDILTSGIFSVVEPPPYETLCVCLFVCLWDKKLVSRLRPVITEPLPRQIYYSTCCCRASPQLILSLEMKMTGMKLNKQ